MPRASIPNVADLLAGDAGIAAGLADVANVAGQGLSAHRTELTSGCDC